MKPDATILAFDFGTRRIGVAHGNSLSRVAHALTTVSDASPMRRIETIAALVREWQPTQLVVGLPVHADGTPHVMTRRARRFARDLGDRFTLPVALVDERWSTQTADVLLRGSGRDGRAARDAAAAAVILQAWFDAPDERA